MGIALFSAKHSFHVLCAVLWLAALDSGVRADVLYSLTINYMGGRTLNARGNFALTLDMEGRSHDARREYEAVLHAQRHRYGPRHPHVLHTQYNLALLLHNRLGDARGGECQSTITHLLATTW